MKDYAVGDVIMNTPPEPPIGTWLKAYDVETGDVFSLVRTREGWHQSGMPRPYAWSTVLRMFLQAKVVRLPRDVPNPLDDAPQPPPRRHDWLPFVDGGRICRRVNCYAQWFRGRSEPIASCEGK